MPMIFSAREHRFADASHSRLGLLQRRVAVVQRVAG